MQLFILTGRVAKQAEVRSTDNGSQAINFRVAATETYRDAQGERHERTTYYQVVQWKKADQSTKVAEYLTPGREVTIQGTVKANVWSNSEGKPQGEVEVRCTRLELGGGGKKDAADATATGAGAPVVSNEDDNDLPF